MSFIIPRSALSILDHALSLEWLEANGLGGFASSTVLGTNTRRYHGLLIAARSTTDRCLLLSRFEETLVIGKRRAELSTNEFDGVFHPRGVDYLERFEREVAVHFDFRVEGFLIRKSVLAMSGENTTLVRYELLEGPSACLLELRPLVAGRDIHALTHENGAINTVASFEQGVLRYAPYQALPELFIRIDQGRFMPQREWWRRFHYREDAARGFDCSEDLFSPGVIHSALFPGAPLFVLCSAAEPTARRSEQLWVREFQRRQSLSISADPLLSEVSALCLSADQVIVSRPVVTASDRRGEDSLGRSIIAGYPWFTDWGRDAMISLPGICLRTKRYQDAREILLLFRRYLKDGLLPNRFPEGSEAPEYNSVDASLWAFEAVWQYLQETNDSVTVWSELYPMLIAIEESFRHGTQFGIRVDSDGLLAAGSEETQLTWMDAKVGGAPVTPRFGKPVEINALWVNALFVLERLSDLCGDSGAVQRFRKAADQSAEVFLKSFWIPEKEYFADVLVPERDGSTRVDTSMRPNQVIALGLSFAFVPETYARLILAHMRAELLTGVGLRTLGPGERGYCAHYRGGPAERDQAYHQGTAWPWLLAPYLRAVARYGTAEELARDGDLVLSGLSAHLREAGIGSISEIFDADEPQQARGCPFQSWSVAAAIECFDQLGKWTCSNR